MSWGQGHEPTLSLLCTYSQMVVGCKLALRSWRSGCNEEDKAE